MRIWVVKTSEMLGTDPGGRLLRSGMLAHVLDSRGHEVSWWVSTFDHARRSHRQKRDYEQPFGQRGRIHALHSPGYGKVVSLRRIVDHVIWGLRFRKAIELQPRPDLILCSYPTIESAWVAVQYAKRAGIPAILDLRDMWPDALVEALPRPVRLAGRIALQPYYSLARDAVRGASGIVGITDEFLDWGLTMAGRVRGVNDAAFPLAYPGSAVVTRPPKRAPGADFLVALVGSLNGQRYEMDCVIEAARRLRADQPRVRFVVAGDGDNLQRYKSAAHDCPNMEFTGWLGAAELAKLLSSAAVGLVPYRNTPDFMMSVPNKAVEYLASGVPVLTSLRGTLPRVLDASRCGARFDASNPETLCAIIRDLRDDPARLQDMSVRAATLFRREFAAEVVYERFASHLERVAAGVVSR